MLSIPQIKSIFQELGVKPSKKLGQNFLVNEKAAEAIIQAGELKENDIVLEIGPGLGALTERMAGKVKRLIAVEKDAKLFNWLKSDLRYKSLDLIRGDVLEMNKADLLGGAQFFKVIANIPYEITSPLLNWLLIEWPRPEKIVFVVQKEIADRILAIASKTNRLAIFCRLFGGAKLAGYIWPASFWPKPNVDSTIIVFENIQKPDWLEEKEVKNFLELVKKGFSSPRKKIRNNLKRELNADDEKLDLMFNEAGLSGNERAENLDLDNWKMLYLLDCRIISCLSENCHSREGGNPDSMR